jgi:RHS repeat-associated protein
MSNAKGRVAEAYTTSLTSCTGANKLTDIGFGYSARGEVTDTYESTPNSGGYFHSTASYWANGALNTLNPLNSTTLPSFTYAVEGEGRPAQVSASAGLNPVVSSMLYDNAAYQTYTLNYGTGDQDIFTLDSNTGRMKNYQFTVGSTPQTVSGQLGWNPNGTLGSLNIADAFNSANSQNCSYSYDDLARIAGDPNGNIPYGVDCETNVWGQYFTYDAFGNIKKFVPTGSTGTSFQPTYDPSTNHITAFPGLSCMSGNTNTCYDANGNTLKDNLHSYTWDAEGKAITIDTVNLAYDALGRMIEQTQAGPSYTQILYGPTGQKLALMGGQAVTKAFIPLPAGATAVYTSGPTLAFFRHPDWLGSSRFASTPSRTMYSDLAYAPFGETYAEAGTPDRSFTGQNQDTVPGSTGGLYDFMYRQLAQYGRWISPDPAGLKAVTLSDPQTWNQYAYARNSPLNRVDRLGLDDGPDPGDNGGNSCSEDNNQDSASSGDDSSGDDSAGGDDSASSGDDSSGGDDSAGGGGDDDSGGGGGGGGDDDSGGGGDDDGGRHPPHLMLVPGVGRHFHTTSQILFGFRRGSGFFGRFGSFRKLRAAEEGQPSQPTQPSQPSQPGKGSCQNPPKKKCSITTRIAGAIEALSGAGDAVVSFSLAGVHFGAAGVLVSAGCLDPTPFEPATCLAGGFGGASLAAGGTVLGGLGVLQVKEEVIPGIKQAINCEP